MWPECKAGGWIREVIGGTAPWSQSNGTPTALTTEMKVKTVSQLTRPYPSDLCSQLLFPAPSHIRAIPGDCPDPSSLHPTFLVIWSSI